MERRRWRGEGGEANRMKQKHQAKTNHWTIPWNAMERHVLAIQIHDMFQFPYRFSGWYLLRVCVAYYSMSYRHMRRRHMIGVSHLKGFFFIERIWGNVQQLRKIEIFKIDKNIPIQVIRVEENLFFFHMKIGNCCHVINMSKPVKCTLFMGKYYYAFIFQ